MNEEIPWAQIAKSVKKETGNDACGTDPSRLALDKIIGKKNIQNAVDIYLEDKDEGFFIISILRQIESPYAAEYCHEIMDNEQNDNKRENAIWILKELSDIRSLEKCEEWLKDSNPNIQNITMMLVDQYNFNFPNTSDKVDELIEIGIKSKNRYVSKLAKNLKENIEKSDLRQKILEEAEKDNPGLLKSSFSADDD